MITNNSLNWLHISKHFCIFVYTVSLRIIEKCTPMDQIFAPTAYI